MRLFFFLFVLTAPAFANQDQAQCFAGYRMTLENSFREFQSEQYRNRAQESGMVYSQNGRGSTGLSANTKKLGYGVVNQYPAGDSRNYMVDQIMGQVSSFAMQLAQTAGTEMAGQSAQQLQSQAAQLQSASQPTATNPNGVPQFAQMSQQLNQEASAISAGDTQAATEIANQISQNPQPPVSSSYVPTPQQNQFLASLGNILLGAGTTLTMGIFGGAAAVLGGQLGTAIFGSNSGVNLPNPGASMGQAVFQPNSAGNIGQNYATNATSSSAYQAANVGVNKSNQAMNPAVPAGGGSNVSPGTYIPPASGGSGQTGGNVSSVGN